MTTQTWLDRHNQAYTSPLDPYEKVLVGMMRSIDLLIANTVGGLSGTDIPTRPHVIRLLAGFIGLLISLPTTGRLDRGTLDDWARSRAALVGIEDDDEFPDSI